MPTTNRQIALQDDLNSVKNGTNTSNYMKIMAGFMAKGILESEITPRVNVFKYKGWLAEGRQVQKGEKGVKIVSVITDRNGRKRPTFATVFHISQTLPKGESRLEATVTV